MKRIVIKVQLDCDKCRSKALKIAAVSKGVVSLSLEGERNDEVVITGEGVDAVNLTSKMRKRFRYATLISMEDVKDSEEGDEDDGSEQGNETTTMENSSLPAIYLPPCTICASYLPPSYLYYYHPDSCYIL